MSKEHSDMPFAKRTQNKIKFKMKLNYQNILKCRWEAEFTRRTDNIGYAKQEK